MGHSEDDGHHHGEMPRWMHVLLLALVALLVIMAVVASCNEHAGTERERTESVR